MIYQASLPCVITTYLARQLCHWANLPCSFADTKYKDKHSWQRALSRKRKFTSSQTVSNIAFASVMCSILLDILQHTVRHWNCAHGSQFFLFYCSCTDLFYPCSHYNDAIMGAMASQITSLTIVYSIVYSDADQRKHQSSASLVFVGGIHRGPGNSPHKWPVTRKMFPFDDVIMISSHYHPDDKEAIVNINKNMARICTRNRYHNYMKTGKNEPTAYFMLHTLYAPLFKSFS